MTSRTRTTLVAGLATLATLVILITLMVAYWQGTARAETIPPSQPIEAGSYCDHGETLVWARIEEPYTSVEFFRGDQDDQADVAFTTTQAVSIGSTTGELLTVIGWAGDFAYSTGMEVPASTCEGPATDIPVTPIEPGSLQPDVTPPADDPDTTTTTLAPAASAGDRSEPTEGAVESHELLDFVLLTFFDPTPRPLRGIW